MIRRLAHLCFTTDQLPAMVHFYTHTLGLSVKFTLATKDGEIFGYYLDCGASSFLEIFDRVGKTKQWGGTPEPLTSGNRYNHFCLEVTALKDLIPTLQQRGAKITEPRTGMDGSLQAWTSDPDGNAIELMEYTHQSRQLRPGHKTV